MTRAILALTAFAFVAPAFAGDWGQFRGPQGQGAPWSSPAFARNMPRSERERRNPIP